MQRFKLCYHLIAITIAVLTATAVSQAAPIFFDDFNKADQPLIGTTPNVGGAWGLTGSATTNAQAIVGNAVPLASSGQDVYSAFTSPVADVAGSGLHTSADITVTSIPANTTGDYFLHLSDPVATSSFFFQRLLARAAGTPSGSTFQLGMLATGGGGGIADYGSTELNLNQQYHVDVYWNFVGGALNDTFTILVNGAPYATHTWNSTNPEPTTISAANFRQGSATSGAPTVVVDNYAVEVVPEPASVLMLMIGAVLAWSRRGSR